MQRFWLGPLVLGLLALAVPPQAFGQMQAPPNNGFNATIAPPSTIENFWTGVDQGLEESREAIDHLTGPNGAKIRLGTGSLDGLQPGTAVSVRYIVNGIQASADPIAGASGLKVNEGIVTSVDRDKKRIAITFTNGATETLRAASNLDPTKSRVIVYYTLGSGHRVANYFKPKH